MADKRSISAIAAKSYDLPSVLIGIRSFIVIHRVFMKGIRQIGYILRIGLIYFAFCSQNSEIRMRFFAKYPLVKAAAMKRLFLSSHIFFDTGWGSISQIC